MVFSSSKQLLGLGIGADGFGSRHIGIVARLRQGQGLHVGVHALCHALAGGYRLDYRAGAVGDIARREYAGTGGVTVLIHGDDAAASPFKPFGGVDDVASHS